MFMLPLAQVAGWTLQNVILIMVVINYLVPDFTARMVKAIKGETVPPPIVLPGALTARVNENTTRLIRLEQAVTGSPDPATAAHRMAVMVPKPMALTDMPTAPKQG